MPRFYRFSSKFFACRRRRYCSSLGAGVYLPLFRVLLVNWAHTHLHTHRAKPNILLACLNLHTISDFLGRGGEAHSHTNFNYKQKSAVKAVFIALKKQHTHAHTFCIISECARGTEIIKKIDLIITNTCFTGVYGLIHTHAHSHNNFRR